MPTPVITFIGAGSTVFTKNIAGDILSRPSLAQAEIRLMDINPERLAESEIIVGKLAQTLGGKASVKTYTDQKRALTGADFVVVCFQIGGYDPCTITDFEVPKKFGLRQTIADTLGIGGIMRGLRTVPHLWSICDDLLEVAPNAIMLQYVNPMAINTWAIAAKYPTIRQVGLCHSVQGTAYELARDLDIPVEEIRYRAGGINHMAFYLTFEHRQPDGSFKNLYPDLVKGYREGRFPKPSHWNPRCPNKVRYEMLTRLGYFVTESSEHFAEYTPWFIKRDRPDLIEKFGIPLDEYPKRCVEQIARWKKEAEALKSANTVEVKESHEYASEIPQLPTGCAVEVPVLVDHMGLQPTVVHDIPPQLIALMRTNINVQDLTVQALLTENPDHIYHAAMLDPHTGAELDLDQIWAMTHDLLAAHGDWLPEWARVPVRKAG
jgi:alpha-galactosidase